LEYLIACQGAQPTENTALQGAYHAFAAETWWDAADPRQSGSTSPQRLQIFGIDAQGIESWLATFV
jgi:hypothetical protein